jgi:Putative prokaryotic signal transducing protein
MIATKPCTELVSLSTAPNPALAHIWANVLRGEGIDCQVVGDFLDAGIGDISGVQPEIWVNRQDMTQAQAVLGRCMQAVVDGGTSQELSWPGVDGLTMRDVLDSQPS